MAVSKTDDEYATPDDLDGDDYDQSEPSNIESFVKLFLLLPAYIVVLTIASIGKLTQEFINWVLDYDR